MHADGTEEVAPRVRTHQPLIILPLEQVVRAKNALRVALSAVCGSHNINKGPDLSHAIKVVEAAIQELP